ncbi:MAG: HNH endonuclease [Pseudomonadota bacterium]
MLSSSVLVLNRSFLPVHITSLKRAFCMLYAGIARAVDEEFHTFDFHSWAELSLAVHDESVGLVGRLIKVPRVIVLTAYDHLPKRSIKFSRLNIMIRDKYTCQYCNKKLPRSKLNLDHVVPRCRGGRTNWENVVTSCFDCNRQKGMCLPREAGLKLVKSPGRPRTTPFIDGLTNSIRYEQWKPFFNVVDYSYWNVELEE